MRNRAIMAESVKRFAFVTGLVGTLLAGCGGSIGAPGTMSQASVSTPEVTKQKYKVLHSFQGSGDGGVPLSEDAPLVVRHGLLYGTTGEGGVSGCGYQCGTLFFASQLGSESVLYAFKGQPDGENPAGPPIYFDGAWYGTTAGGGASNNGMVFAIGQSGHERNVYSFKGGSDGSAPFGGLVAYQGMLYGTTSLGGKHRLGTVFSVSASGTERVVHSFGFHDGQNPYAGLTVLDGTLYGTTIYGGTINAGTVFAISSSGKERVVYNFNGTDGGGPGAPLVVIGGELYGTTTGGGASDAGTVFKISTSGKEQVLHSFQEGLNDGYDPASMLVDLNGTLYGTTYLGGRKGLGVIFSVSTSGKERVLHNFRGRPDGRYPTGGLTALNGTLYGTTVGGGKGPCYNGLGCGTIYALTP